MSLPYFFHAGDLGVGEVQLDEGTSRHLVQVLRMPEGALLVLTDGKGTEAQCRILLAHKKHSRVEVVSRDRTPAPRAAFSIGIALTKSKSRNEWLLEKLTEIGVAHIYPLICERSERDKFNFDRYNSILIAALIQSRQTFLPVLHEPQRFSAFAARRMPDVPLKLVAHCGGEGKQGKQALSTVLRKDTNTLMLIGPEGDFSPAEVALCLSNQFIPVTLGPNRLRTETAGIYACTAFNLNQHG